MDVGDEKGEEGFGKDGVDELVDLLGLGVDVGRALEGGLGEGEGAGEFFFGLLCCSAGCLALLISDVWEVGLTLEGWASSFTSRWSNSLVERTRSAAERCLRPKRKAMAAPFGARGSALQVVASVSDIPDCDRLLQRLLAMHNAHAMQERVVLRLWYTTANAGIHVVGRGPGGVLHLLDDHISSSFSLVH